jgi:hypothetical protein
MWQEITTVLGASWFAGLLGVLPFLGAMSIWIYNSVTRKCIFQVEFIGEYDSDIEKDIPRERRRNDGGHFSPLVLIRIRNVSGGEILVHFGNGVVVYGTTLPATAGLHLGTLDTFTLKDGEQKTGLFPIVNETELLRIQDIKKVYLATDKHQQVRMPRFKVWKIKSIAKEFVQSKQLLDYKIAQNEKQFNAGEIYYDAMLLERERIKNDWGNEWLRLQHYLNSRPDWVQLFWVSAMCSRGATRKESLRTNPEPKFEFDRFGKVQREIIMLLYCNRAKIKHVKKSSQKLLLLQNGNSHELDFERYWIHIPFLEQNKILKKEPSLTPIQNFNRNVAMSDRGGEVTSYNIVGEYDTYQLSDEGNSLAQSMEKHGRSVFNP